MVLNAGGDRVLGVVPRVCLKNRRELASVSAAKLGRDGEDVPPSGGGGGAVCQLIDPLLHTLCLEYGHFFTASDHSAVSPLDSIWLTILTPLPRKISVPGYLYLLLEAEVGVGVEV